MAFFKKKRNCNEDMSVGIEIDRGEEVVVLRRRGRCVQQPSNVQRPQSQAARRRLRRAAVARQYFLSAILSFLFLSIFVSCSGNQFAEYHIENFDTTQVTTSTQKVIYVANNDTSEEQHIRVIAFDKGSNSAGHFRMDSAKVGDQSVGTKDIVIPPGSALSITVTYAPLNMETTFANYGGWETGRPDRFVPYPTGERPEKDDGTAIHRAILQASYDYPRSGLIQIELVGQAIVGPNGEIEAGGKPGECIAGDGVACYTGGFAVDIPQLYSGGPRDLELGGAVKFTLSGGEATMRMDDFPPALMVLRYTEIPELPPGVVGTLVISGGQGKAATGTFDGSRITMKDVVFRIRFVLGEATAADVTPGMASMIDFEVPNLEIETIEPLSQGNITLHLETTLSEKPSGNDLFDQFLSGAKVVVVMKGQLAF